mmetsp:Transcript_37264/g.60356  ORF Transcript_37264/g.60356 Transcript_37264/m.60356 type:complete len:241 (+) Transcript_37264:32-754(+)
MDGVLGMLHSAKVIDLTQVLKDHNVVWPGSVPLLKNRYAEIEPDGYVAISLHLDCGCGTHIDSPSHMLKGGREVEKLGLNELLFLPGVLVDVSSKAASEADYQLQVSDLTEWEFKHGRIPLGSLVMMRCGWDRLYDSKDAYTGLRESDQSLHFPSFSEESVRWLLAERDIVGIGIDTLSPDTGRDNQFPVHMAMFGADKFIVENMRLYELPPSGSIVIISPLNLSHVSEAPCRVFGIVPP